ncbi:MAG: 4-hydroxybenzoate octaprenyltransferase [Alphaproteobacteria bacterium]
MSQPHTDINRHGIIGKLPQWAKPYGLLSRLDRPIGTWLLLLPCLWSIAMARPITTRGWGYTIMIYILFIIGAFLMRAAGCVINDMWDKKFDAAVERTKHRPLASGELNMRQAFIFLFILLFLSFLIFLILSPVAKILALLSLIPVSLYPLAKRFTNWPQLVLGFTFNWGALLGWAAIRNDLAWPAFWLWIGGVFWTLIYDTIYAHQDKEDDAKLGLKSTALTLGDKTQAAALFISLCMGISFMIAGILAHMNIFYYMALLVMVGFHGLQLIRLDINDASQCLRSFKQSRYAGWILLLGILLG